MAQNYNNRQRDNTPGQDWQRDDPQQSRSPRGSNPQQQYHQQGGNPQQQYYRQGGNPQQQYYRQGGNPQQQYSRQGGNPQQQYSRQGGNPQQQYYRQSGNPQQQYSRQGGNPQQQYYRQSGSDPYTAYVTPPGGPRRGRKKSNTPLIILLVVLGLGVLVAGGKLASIFLNYQKDRSAYNSLADNAVSSTVPVSYRDAPEDDTETVPETEIPIEVDWDYLQSVNPNVVGWLYCPDTIINYPVVQTRDHEYYLEHGFDGTSNTAGTLFADMDSVLGVTQSHYIVYGHNMKDDSMFGTVANYVDESYYEEHPTLYYLTPTQCYRIDLFCARYVEADTENYTTYFSSTEDYQAYLNKMSTDCFWLNTDVMSTDYQLFSMSTCVYPSGYVNPRLLVQGVMVPIE